MRIVYRASLLAATLSLLPSCATESTSAGQLEPYECGSVKRLHTLGGVFLASQPSADDFKLAASSGVKTVVNLRTDGELDWDEKSVVEGLGMTYHHVPFRAPETLTEEVLDETRRLLSASDNKPLLLHCASANRVGAIWLAHRVLDQGVSYEDAMAEARTVGLKMPGYESRVDAYIEKHREP